MKTYTILFVGKGIKREITVKAKNQSEASKKAVLRPEVKGLEPVIIREK